MSDIPEARRRLLMIADMAEPETAKRIRSVVKMFMTREKAVRCAPVKSKGIQPSIALRIRQMAYNNPTMHVAEIAALFGVNPGRVSEVLHGRRK